MSSRNTGLFIIVIGIIMMVYTGFNFVTSEKVVDLGPIKINEEKNHLIKWPPIIGAILVIGGIGLAVKGKNINS